MARFGILKLPFLILLVSSSLSSAGAVAQEAQVTFYSNGSMLKESLPLGTKQGAFLGAIFDGEQRIGFCEPKRFITVRVLPGHHIFSTRTNSKSKTVDSQLALDIDAGRVYFIRVQEEVKGVLITSFKGRMDQVSCAVAHEDSGKFGPTNPKYIAPEMRSKISSESSIPACESQ